MMRFGGLSYITRVPWCLLFLSARPSDSREVGKCVSSCVGESSGIHQSCDSCGEYVLCNNGHLTKVPCDPGKTYDDTVRACVYWSSTCGVKESDGTCVSSCLGVPDGNYQSCRGCDVYVICSSNMRYDDVPCPDEMVWDDSPAIKNCVLNSTTCPPDSANSGEENQTNAPPAATEFFTIPDEDW